MRRKPISETLREAVRACPRSRNRLGQLSGISPSILSRFVNERRALTLRVIDPLCEALGLELRPIRPAKKSHKPNRNG